MTLARSRTHLADPNFAGLPDALVAALQANGWQALRPFQAEAVRAIQGGCNTLVVAPTGGGKTEAALLPILGALARPERAAVRVVGIAPTRALLNDQLRRWSQYAEWIGSRAGLWHGDVEKRTRTRILHTPPSLLLTTPESFERLAAFRPALFDALHTVVVDELHVLAGDDRGTQVHSIVAGLAARSGRDVQRIGLSATLGNPEEVLDWISGASDRPRCVVQRSVHRRPVVTFHHPGSEAREVATRARELADGCKTLFFCESRGATEDLAQAVAEDEARDVHVHHGSLSRHWRQHSEDAFRAARQTTVVCTSTLELGVDVGDLDLVLQLDAPSTVRSYLQRLGRSGRSEGSARRLAFLARGPWPLMRGLALADLARQGWVEPAALDDRNFCMLVQRLLVMAHTRPGSRLEHAQALRELPDFRGVLAHELWELVGHLTSEGWLATSIDPADSAPHPTESLALGPRAQERFGTRGFSPLFTVFRAPVEYRVMSSSEDVGTLDPRYAEHLPVGAVFLLGGLSWTLCAIDHRARAVHVEPATQGEQPKWGRGGRPLGLEVCRRMRRLLQVDQVPEGADDGAASTWHALRRAHRDVVGRRWIRTEAGRGAFQWFTFAGDRINRTLRLMLPRWVGGTIEGNQVQVRARGAGATDQLRTALTVLAHKDWTKDPIIQAELAEATPRLAVSKFEALLPRDMQREVRTRAHLDLAGAQACATLAWRSEQR